MARGKNKPKFNNPMGAPYILFETNEGFTVGTSYDNIKKKYKKAFPVNVLSLIKKFGHHGANSTIRQYAKTWVCKDGKIYIRELNV